MTIEIRDEPGVIVATLAGRLDSTNSSQTQASLLEGLRGANRLVVLEMSGVEYVSSAGLRAILMAAKQVAANHGKIVAASMQDQVKEIFEIAGFDSLVPSYGDVTLAIAGLKTQP